MKVKLKDPGNKIPYGSSQMGFAPEDRVSLNNGGTVELDSIPEKGADYVVQVGNQKSSPTKGDSK